MCKYTNVEIPLDKYLKKYYYRATDVRERVRKEEIVPVVYCKSRRRRPIWVGVRAAMQDVRAELPVGWCPNCGMECYLDFEELCEACKEEKEHEQQIPL